MLNALSDRPFIRRPNPIRRHARRRGHRLPYQEYLASSRLHLSLYTDQVPNARSLSLSPDGILYVGTWNAGKVYAVADTNQDGQADNIWTLATKLNVPNGVAFHNGDLYVAEINRILRFKNIESHLDNPPIPEVIRDDFPTDKAHDWKFIRFGPDGLLYLPVGAPCNICERDDPYASITRMLPDGSGFEIFARGIRNSVGFDWHPHNKNLWFTDNGRDWLGDDIPPDELNHAPQAGLHFGFPYCHGGDLPDPEYGESKPCSEFTAPAQKLGPHVAAFGMRFYTGTLFPSPYRNQIFIAEHGLWNRSDKSGYRIMQVTLEGNKATMSSPRVGCKANKLGGGRWTWR